MASLAPSVASLPLSGSTLLKPSLLGLRLHSSSLRPPVSGLPRLSLSVPLRGSDFPLTPFVAQTSGWTQQQLDDATDFLPGDGQEEGDVSWSEDEGEVQDGGLGETDQDLGDGFDAEEEEEEAVQTQEEAYSEPPEEAKLFVGNLPFDLTSESLAQLFDKAGVVEIAEVDSFLCLPLLTFLLN